MKNNPTVFLIDDDADDQEIFSLAMRKANLSANCVFADDGILALEKINTEQSFSPDYIFLDINMPRMGGGEVLSELKKIERLKNVPVFFYSTSADAVTIAENKNLGATDFIVKPTNINDLSTILSGIIRSRIATFFMFIAFLSTLPAYTFAQSDSLSKVNNLKKLSVEALMNVVVTSVSKSPEKLTDVASAIQVIRSSDIRRSTATRLPELLQLAPNLIVAQSNSHDWSITARGFNSSIGSTSLSDKLLVLIDGRTVYNPLFGGVYWDVQNVVLGDIDRVEVVSGPGGTLWGANAVNGVVNVISKSSKETQGVLVSGSGGSFLQDKFVARYGGRIDSNLYFRVYGQHFDYGNTNLPDGASAKDSWNTNEGGFRMDYYPSEKNMFTLQGDLYGGSENDSTPTKTNGQNILGRFTHTFSNTSNLTIQGYYDRTFRNIQFQQFKDIVTTYDADLQHRFSLTPNHRILWGAGYRIWNDQTANTPELFSPATRTLELINVFVQDQITIIPKFVELTVGSKLLHNYYTKFEVQPSARIAWTPGSSHTIWAAVSRAVRTPSRFDVDYVLLAQGDRAAFKSENVIAYELGYRLHSSASWTISLATFYNQYDNLRSADSTHEASQPFYWSNNLSAKTWGAEISATYILTDWWTLRGGYTFVKKDFRHESPNVIADNEAIEGIDPVNQVIIQSAMDLPGNFKLDLVTRYVDVLPASRYNTRIPAYAIFNASVSWTYKYVTLGVTGRGLPSKQHSEFAANKIPESINGRITLRF